MSAPPKKRPARIDIQSVSPLIDGGRYPAKQTAGRERAVAQFAWDSIAERTLAVYDTVLRRPPR